MTSVRKVDVELPTDEQQAEAVELLRELTALRRGRVVHVRSDDPSGRVDMILPQRVLADLLRILRHTADGDAVTFVPIHAELTTQQAADLLNVSRPTLIKLLGEGAIPFTTTGRHRRVLAKDLLAYRDKRHQESLAAFAEMANMPQQSGGY